jgi:hypothetical protein
MSAIGPSGTLPDAQVILVEEIEIGELELEELEELELEELEELEIAELEEWIDNAINHRALYHFTMTTSHVDYLLKYV